MRIVDEKRSSDRGQSPVSGVEEGVCGVVVLRAYPLALKDAPQCLGNVEVRRVRREVEEEKPSDMSMQAVHGLGVKSMMVSGNHVVSISKLTP